MKARRALLSRALLAAALAHSLAGCAPEPPTATPPPPAPPPGAIRVADDLYMVPIDRDRDGCERFSAWSAAGLVLAVIYYRAKVGGFTMIKSQADCGAPAGR